jgi:nitrogen fixation protein NifU and related proteins
MYNRVIIDNFSNPNHNGKLNSPDFSIELGNPICGDKIIVQGFLSNDQVITESKFQAWGCATTIATANVFCGYLLNRSVNIIRETTKEKINTLLGDLEPSQYHCLEMLRNLFQKVGEISPDKQYS